MSLEFDVYGRRVLVERADAGWIVLYPGTEGKRQAARDIVIPPDTPESELARYLADLCHEWATPERSTVRRLD